MGIQYGDKALELSSRKKSLFTMKIISLALVALTGFLFFQSSDPLNAEIKTSGEIRILKSEVKSQVKFYPVTVDGVEMEVLAVRASDGTIRTAFNTCQVCYDSGRGYYVQQKDELVCQNCGNRFLIDQVEKVKNGCNPVPITTSLKTDDGKYIIISKSVLVKAKNLFERWEKK